MEKIKNRYKEPISSEEKEKIFDEYINDYIITRIERCDREKAVLIDKVEIHTEGKEILLENTIVE